MKMVPVLAILVLFATAACTQPPAAERAPGEIVASPESQTNEVRIEFPDQILVMSDADPADFRVVVNGKTAEIKGLAVGATIDGKKISLPPQESEILTARVQFRIGVLQYLNDDVRAEPLHFSYDSPWSELETSNKEIQIPQYYPNKENVKTVYEQLGLANEGEYSQWLIKKFFDKIKQVSLQRQTDFYSKLLKKDRARYQECCPEYIEQAKEFLNRRPADFKTISDLAVEFYLSRMTLEISVQSKDGKRNVYTLVQDQK